MWRRGNIALVNMATWVAEVASGRSHRVCFAREDNLCLDPVLVLAECSHLPELSQFA
jgi:hypothetical protein